MFTGLLSFNFIKTIKKIGSTYIILLLLLVKIGIVKKLLFKRPNILSTNLGTIIMYNNIIQVYLLFDFIEVENNYNHMILL